MGDVKVSNSKPVTTEGLSLSGSNGKKLSKEEEKLARVIANLDGKAKFSQSDIEKLKKMSPADQIKYINNALKGSGYKVADVYNSEEESTTSGVTWTSDGLFINFSQGGQTIQSDIMGDGTRAGALRIQFKK